MPRYFFHVWTGEHLERDERGVELAGLHQAIEEALLAVEDLSSADLSDHVLHVADEIGMVVGIPFTAPSTARLWLH